MGNLLKELRHFAARFYHRNVPNAPLCGNVPLMCLLRFSVKNGETNKLASSINMIPQCVTYSKNFDMVLLDFDIDIAFLCHMSGPRTDDSGEFVSFFRISFSIFSIHLLLNVDFGPSFFDASL